MGMENPLLRPIEVTSSDFADLRKNGCIYVDKTAYFHRMITTRGRKMCFLARPRRFGKTLMITALKEIFSGNRQYFEGLAIDKTDWAWEKHPVLHFDFGGVNTENFDKFEVSFAFAVRSRLEAAGCEYDSSIPPSDNFGRAIETLAGRSGGKGVVILIDEYDAPVSHVLDRLELAEKIRSALQAFYYPMKSHTNDIRFMMMTGVSKFTKMSVFSTLNNIYDVSMDDDFATMLGYTEEELEANFEPHLRAHAERMRLSWADYRAELRRWYNGFRFAKFNDTTVYNPISVAIALAKKEPHLSATWSSTGRPSTLMNCLKRGDMLAIDPARTTGVGESEFDVTDLANLKPIGMLFQTGYLTIKDYEEGLYTLGVPDEEVRQDLNLLLAGLAADQDVAWAASLGIKLRTARWEEFFLGLKSLYAHMVYGSTEHRVHENAYARCLAFLLAGSGFRFTLEDVQASVRADIVASHTTGTFIFELKVDEPVDRAFTQLRAKHYETPYLASAKPIWLIGLSFDSKTRTLADCAAEKL